MGAAFPTASANQTASQRTTVATAQRQVAAVSAKAKGTTGIAGAVEAPSCCGSEGAGATAFEASDQLADTVPTTVF